MAISTVYIYSVHYKYVYIVYIVPTMHVVLFCGTFWTKLILSA